MIIRDMGLTEYQPVYDAMREFTAHRDEHTCDELWLLEHQAVFTQGFNGKDEHVLDIGNIPLVNTDRGGQVTYHAPGQFIAYTLFDLRRYGIGVRQMVSCLENSVISLLANLGVTAESRLHAPGVYVDDYKIAALGLRVKRGVCYHGMSLNVAMDLTPFSFINPCGYQDMKVMDLAGIGCDIAIKQIKQQFVPLFAAQIKQATNETSSTKNT